MEHDAYPDSFFSMRAEIFSKDLQGTEYYIHVADVSNIVCNHIITFMITNWILFSFTIIQVNTHILLRKRSFRKNRVFPGCCCFVTLEDHGGVVSQFFSYVS